MDKELILYLGDNEEDIRNNSEKIIKITGINYFFNGQDRISSCIRLDTDNTWMRQVYFDQEYEEYTAYNLAKKNPNNEIIDVTWLKDL